MASRAAKPPQDWTAAIGGASPFLGTHALPAGARPGAGPGLGVGEVEAETTGGPWKRMPTSFRIDRVTVGYSTGGLEVGRELQGADEAMIFRILWGFADDV
jgi:hypothetical protein